jgi:hypothetical protein
VLGWAEARQSKAARRLKQSGNQEMCLNPASRRNTSEFSALQPFPRDLLDKTASI